MTIDPAEKMITKDRMEKYILRKAFDTTDEPNTQPYLPQNILWRQKEQFSDGVGYGWIDALKDNANAHITDEQMQNPKPEWGDDVPDTKEAYWYRLMFDDLFPAHCASTVMRWTPTWSNQTDPSGRLVFAFPTLCCSVFSFFGARITFLSVWCHSTPFIFSLILFPSLPPFQTSQTKRNDATCCCRAIATHLAKYESAPASTPT